MDGHSCEATVVTCIDFRFQEFIDQWIKENLGTKNHDRVALAGGVKSFDIILGQIEISKKLHDIKKVILINHEDCGAYGSKAHIDHHIEDLKQASKTIKEKFPNLQVETYYLHLDGTFEPIS